MFRAFQKTDPLYYVGLVFMVFPLGGVAWFGYPNWTIILSTLFALAYIIIIHIKDSYRKTIAFLWFYLLFYIIFMTTQIEGISVRYRRFSSTASGRKSSQGSASARWRVYSSPTARGRRRCWNSS